MHKLLLILTALISVFTVQSQIVTSNTMTPAQLVSNILVGSGVTVSNVTFNGSAVNATNIQPNALSFNATNFPFSNGLYLRTAGGANVAFDPDLNAISTNTITNGAILEFDFVPMGDSLVFNYMFASAEYPTYVCSGFNDVFGFFISGPGFAGPYSLGAVNIALVPGTTVPVAINTVNSGVAGGAGNAATCAAQDPNWQSNSIYYTTMYANYSGAGFNGGTVSLPALAQLQCGQTYHIKLAVSNVGDTALDSGVYIEGGSFATNAVEVAVATVTGDTVVYEGCSTADLMFIRPENQTTDTLTVGYDISGTATIGTDFNNIPNPVTFLPGVDTVIITIDPYLDGISDNNEFITITAYTVTPCGDTLTSTGTLWILDELIIDIDETDPTVYCATDSVMVSAVVNDPNNWLFPPFTYAWTGGQVGQTAYFPTTPPMTGSIDYYVTITNSCGYTAVDTVTVTLNQTLVVDNLTATPTDDCGFLTGGVSGTAAGVTGTPFYHWDNQANWIGGGTGGAFYDGAAWNGLNSGWYYFTVTDNVCSAVDSIYVGVQNMSLVIDSMIPSITDGCGNANGGVIGYASGDAMNLGPASYLWENQPGTDSEPENFWTGIPPGWYIFTVNVGLCETTDSVFVGMDNPPVAAFTAFPTTGCSPLTVNMINESQNATSYYWDFGDGTFLATNNMDGQTIVYTQTATIQLIASQNQFCTDITDQLIIVDICGCTNPTASNYDPTATLDDGSCYFPIPTVNVPNVFTPNGDGDNDIFFLETTNAIQVNMVITNRWGNVMFEESYDPNDFIDPVIPVIKGYGWDGRSNIGLNAEDGTYFVKYTVTGVNGDMVEGHGFLHLVRN